MHDIAQLASHLLKMRDKTRSFVTLEKDGDSYIVVYKDRKVPAFISNEIASPQKTEEYVIFASNTKKNVDAVVKNWDAYVSCEKLTITFINLTDGSYWSLKPAIHAKIGTKESIYSLFEASSSVALS